MRAHTSTLERTRQPARRQQVIDRLQRDHPAWPSERILLAALCQENRRANPDYLREVAAHIAAWSETQPTEPPCRVT